MKYNTTESKRLKLSMEISEHIKNIGYYIDFISGYNHENNDMYLFPMKRYMSVKEKLGRIERSLESISDGFLFASLNIPESMPDRYHTYNRKSVNELLYLKDI